MKQNEEITLSEMVFENCPKCGTRFGVFVYNLGYSQSELEELNKIERECKNHNAEEIIRQWNERRSI